MANKVSERSLIFEEVRKAQSRLNRIASTTVLPARDQVLFETLTLWQRDELAAQAQAAKSGSVVDA